MAVKAIARSEGITPEAVNYLSQVRTRSIPTKLVELEKTLSVLTTDKFLEEVWLERLRELPYEMKQLSDIVRTNYYPVYKDSTLRFASRSSHSSRQIIRETIFLSTKTYSLIKWVSSGVAFIRSISESTRERISCFIFIAVR